MKQRGGWQSYHFDDTEEKENDKAIRESIQNKYVGLMASLIKYYGQTVDLCQIFGFNKLGGSFGNFNFDNVVGIYVSLNNMDIYKRKIDFFELYYKKLLYNDTCLCDTLLNKSEQLGEQGKASTVFKYENYIIKRINNVTYKRYLPLYPLSLEKNSQNKRLKEYVNNKHVYFHQRTGKTYQKICLLSPSDSFNNQTIMHMILNIILNDETLNDKYPILKNCYIHQNIAYFCKDKEDKRKINGYNITNFSNSGTLQNYIAKNNITIDKFREILYKICLPLFILKQGFVFTHNDLKTQNIFVNIGNNNELQIKLADYDKSAIVWKGVRFYCKFAYLDGVQRA